MSTKKLKEWMLGRYKSTDSLPKNLRYAAWVNGLKDPYVGLGNKKYSRSLYNELSENQIPITDLMIADTPVCKKIQQAKRFITEHFPNLNKEQPYNEFHREWWLWSRIYNDWGKITKVSDLFVKGLGSFDFVTVAGKIYEPWNLKRAYIQGDGYFPKAVDTHHYHIASMFFNHKDTLQYLIKYWAVLKGHEHVDGVVQNLRERRYLGMPFMDVHPDKLGLEHGNVTFGWLANASIPGFTIPKTGQELMDAAVKFRNCARNYIASVMRQRSLILWNDTGMAEYHKNHGLGQCSGVGNSRIDRAPFEAIQEQVKKLFK